MSLRTGEEWENATILQSKEFAFLLQESQGRKKRANHCQVEVSVNKTLKN